MVICLFLVPEIEIKAELPVQQAVGTFIGYRKESVSEMAYLHVACAMIYMSHQGVYHGDSHRLGSFFNQEILCHH